MTALSLTTADPATLDVDALVIGLVRTDDGPHLADGAASVDSALGGGLLDALRALGATGAEDEVTRLATFGRLPAASVVAVGLGERNVGSRHEAMRRAAGVAARALAGTASAATTLAAADAGDLPAVVEGLLLGAYAFRRYRTVSGESVKVPLESVQVVVPAENDAARAVIERAQAVVSAVHLARDLVNTPPSDLHPADLAGVAVERCEALGLDVEVLDESALADGGYGGILGVGAGAEHPPRLVRIAYRHPDATAHVALVGKGITFDSGGLSIKPSASMEWMKSDMGGAAAVLATLTAVGQLRPAVNVTGYLAIAENMPSGTAIRPSDVLTMRGGRTVEVLNTDAEGRLVMADAIVRACEESPDAVLDVATLTGAQLVALGSLTFGVMGNDDALRGSIVSAADRTGELAWPMPLPKELRSSLDSDIADIKNTGDRYGGMLVAGLFLQDFVADGVRWAHLDIAGPAFNQGKEFGYTPKGGTGAAVRTLVSLLEHWAS